MSDFIIKEECDHCGGQAGKISTSDSLGGSLPGVTACSNPFCKDGYEEFVVEVEKECHDCLGGAIPTQPDGEPEMHQACNATGFITRNLTIEEAEECGFISKDSRAVIALLNVLMERQMKISGWTIKGLRRLT